VTSVAGRDVLVVLRSELSGARTALQVYHGRGGKSVFYGLAFSPDGKRAWASGGGQGVVEGAVAMRKVAEPFRRVVLVATTREIPTKPAG